MGPSPFCLIYLFSFPHPSHPPPPPFLFKGHPKLVKALAKLYGTLMGREIDPLKEVCKCVLLCLHVHSNIKQSDMRQRILSSILTSSPSCLLSFFPSPQSLLLHLPLSALLPCPFSSEGHHHSWCLHSTLTCYACISESWG